MRRLVLSALLPVLCLLGGWASAEAHEFHAEVKPAILHGIIGGPSFFENTTNSSKVKCKDSYLLGTVSATAVTEITVKPEYTKCTLGETTTVAEVINTGCNYVWAGATNAEGRGAFTIVCETGKSIEVNFAGLCTVKFGSQKATGGVHYENEVGFPAFKRVRGNVSAGGLVYTTSGLFCSTYFGNGKDGVITGSFPTEAYQDLGGVAGEQVNFWVE